MKKLLFSRDSELLQPLLALIEEQNHRTLVAWALDSATRVLTLFETRRPHEPRPRQALETAILWAQGKVKMPEAKRAIHAAHSAATESADDSAAQAAARAVAHAAAVVHVETHALGFTFYSLTAFVYDEGSLQTSDVSQAQYNWLYERLLFWQADTSTFST